MKVSGPNLRARRESAGKTPTQAAAAADMSARWLEDKERLGGKMNLNVAKRLAREYGCKLEDIAP